MTAGLKSNLVRAFTKLKWWKCNNCYFLKDSTLRDCHQNSRKIDDKQKELEITKRSTLRLHDNFKIVFRSDHIPEMCQKRTGTAVV